MDEGRAKRALFTNLELRFAKLGCLASMNVSLQKLHNTHRFSIFSATTHFPMILLFS
jgi:hypothetical protein